MALLLMFVRRPSDLPEADAPTWVLDWLSGRHSHSIARGSTPEQPIWQQRGAIRARSDEPTIRVAKTARYQDALGVVAGTLPSGGERLNWTGTAHLVPSSTSLAVDVFIERALVGEVEDTASLELRQVLPPQGCTVPCRLTGGFMIPHGSSRRGTIGVILLTDVATVASDCRTRK